MFLTVGGGFFRKTRQPAITTEHDEDPHQIKKKNVGPGIIDPMGDV